jgi:hypothetical protein
VIDCAPQVCDALGRRVPWLVETGLPWVVALVVGVSVGGRELGVTCRLFGHDWVPGLARGDRLRCASCGAEITDNSETES